MKKCSSTIFVNQIWNNFQEIKEVYLKGWVKSHRDSGAFGFIVFSDGTDFRTIQIVYKKEITKNFEQLKTITTGTAISVHGQLVLTPQAQQPFEILADEIAVLALADTDFPLQKKGHTVEFLREIAHLRPRTNLFQAAMRIRNNLYMALNTFFQTNNFVWVASPTLTNTDAEGNGEAFKLALVDREQFFNSEVSLSGTGQLHAEAYAMAFNKVYTFGPQFRAEKSHTNRHAAEFWMLEPEVAFLEIDGLMDLIETMIKNITQQYLKTCAQEISFLVKFIEPGLMSRLDSIIANNFPRITYTQAVELLTVAAKTHKFANTNIHWGMDLESEHERYLCEQHFNSPIFVYNYPASLKAFYMKLNDDHKTVAGVDLLVPGVGELCGGSQREDNYDVLIKKVKDLKMPLEGLQWYLDLRKYGYHRSAGFGLGFERLIMYLTGINNIRDTIPFPRCHGTIKY